MKTKVFVKIMIASEALFFITLIISYVYFGNHLSEGPASAESLNKIKTAIFSLFLFSSSFTVWMARRSFMQKKYISLRVWLGTTILLGIVFMYGQVTEYLKLYSEQVTINRNIFGTNFYTLTGFHGLHVILGLVALCIVFGLIMWGDIKKITSSAIEGTELYWHFVDGVWVVVFTVVYVIPLLAS